MKLVFTRRALDQIDGIFSYIAERNPHGAVRVRTRIKTVIDRLPEHPHSGTATGHRAGRQIVTNPYPYIVYYRIRGDVVVIQPVRHAARRPLK